MSKRGSGLRLSLVSVADGGVVYCLSGPARARSVLRLAGYDGVEIRPLAEVLDTPGATADAGVMSPGEVASPALRGGTS
jgi:hypothetical protein